MAEVNSRPFPIEVYGLSTDNYPSSATSSNALVQGFTGPNSTIPVPSVADQVSSFLNSSSSSSSNTSLTAPLFVLLGGVNDVLFNPNLTASQSFSVLSGLRAQLAQAYPHADVLVLGYPDLAQLPVDFYTPDAEKRVYHAFGAELSARWRDAARNGTSGRGKGSGRLLFVDTASLFEDFGYYGDPGAYGFAPLGVYGSCLTGVYEETPAVTLCDDPDEMVFWDEYQ